MQIHLNILIQIHIHIQIHVHIHIHTYIYTYVCIIMCIYIYILHNVCAYKIDNMYCTFAQMIHDMHVIYIHETIEGTICHQHLIPCDTIPL